MLDDHRGVCASAANPRRASHLNHWPGTRLVRGAQCRPVFVGTTGRAPRPAVRQREGTYSLDKKKRNLDAVPFTFSGVYGGSAPTAKCKEALLKPLPRSEGPYVSPAEDIWLREAAKQGDAEAQLCLGSELTSSEATAAEGVEWVRRAAEQGYADAQAFLGRSTRQAPASKPTWRKP